MEDFTPRQTVAELDKHIVGQNAAKRAVAIALRNRYRRSRLAEEMRDEVIPKNILMIGPTGVGKTEIARRIAKLVKAPFIKVEASKFTEVGYVGRDVESIIRDLTQTAVRLVEAERMEAVQDRAHSAAVDRIVERLLNPPSTNGGERGGSSWESAFNSVGQMFRSGGAVPAGTPPPPPSPSSTPEDTSKREEIRRCVLSGEMDDDTVEIEVEAGGGPTAAVFGPAGMEEMMMNVQDTLGNMFPKKKKSRRMTVKDALRSLTLEEAKRLVEAEDFTGEAIQRVEQHGIVFLDEMDKIAGREGNRGPDVSREGVQRDLLPIIEGSTVNTRYGPVRTDYILFIAAGAFHVSKPSDLIPELQGRLPIRVELEALGQEDFVRILTEPKSSLTKQYRSLMETEGVGLEFTEDGIAELARVAQAANEQSENIGARRLHTVMERLLEEVSFEASEMDGVTVTVDGAFVRSRLEGILQDADLSKYIL